MADEGAPPDVTDAGDRARDILDGPAFKDPDRSYLARGMGWLGEKIVDFLDWLLGWIDPPSSGPGVAAGGSGYFLGWILLALALGFIAYVLFRVMPRRRLGRAAKTDPIMDRAERTRTSRDEWLERAAAAEGRGDHAAAVHARYRALVAGLVDRRELGDSEGTTSGEHLRSFDRSDARHPDFARSTDRFERIWFGIEAAGPDDTEAMAREDQIVMAGSDRNRSRAEPIADSTEESS